MSHSSPGLNPKKQSGTGGLLGRFKKTNTKDLKKIAKESGTSLQQGYLMKYKEKEAEWKQRWVEVRGGCIMWTSSKGRERSDYKDYIELAGAKLIDECSMFGLDSSGQQKAKGTALMYSVEKGKARHLGTMKEKHALSRDYSWRVVPRSGAAHIFAAGSDMEKEEWWRCILKAIKACAPEDDPAAASLKRAGLEDVPLFSGDKPVSIPRHQVQFDFLSVVGRGSYGRVIKVREISTGNIYVCKVLEKQAILHHRMLREVKKEQALLHKVSHPNIVDLVTAFQTRDKIFLVMEFLCGGELFGHMTAEKAKRFTVDRARFYAAQLVLAIEYLHSLKIIHCDLKAENCVLTADGYMKLTDFGFATTTHEGEKPISRNGTPVYMAPEMIKVNRDVGYSYPVDVWSLGVLLYAMVTGYFPFHGETPALTLRYVCERELAYPPDVPVDKLTKDLLKACLNRDPTARITSTQMKSHKFFAPIKWDDLFHKRITPPFIPDLSGSNTRYFPSSYESSKGDAMNEAHVSMHSVHMGDPVFGGFAFLRSESTKSISILPGDVIVDDKANDEEYMKHLTMPTPQPGGASPGRSPGPGKAAADDTPIPAIELPESRK